MSRDEAFVEYALYALLRDLSEEEGTLPLLRMESDELKKVLSVQQRLRPERIKVLRDLCSGVGIGYATIGGLHYFFLEEFLSPRRFEGKELAQFLETVDDFDAVYGSKKADEMYAARDYRGIHTVEKKKAKNTSVTRVRG
jgi:hypothetical protein